MSEAGQKILVLKRWRATASALPARHAFWALTFAINDTAKGYHEHR